MGIGDWGLGIGDWGLGQSPIPNPQSPIPNPQSPSIIKLYQIYYSLIKLLNFILEHVDESNRTTHHKQLVVQAFYHFRQELQFAQKMPEE